MDQEIAIASSGDLIAVEDATTIKLWLRSKRSEHTQKAYTRDIKSFYTFVKAKREREMIVENVTIKTVTLEDIQDYAEHLKTEHKEVST